jgi:hypothetical protein
VLTCSHEDCHCRVRIEAECHCANAGDAYICTCGAAMVEVPDDYAGSEPKTPAVPISDDHAGVSVS